MQEDIRESQRKLLIDRMESGEEISVRDAMIKYDIGRFQARISELRKIYTILDRWESRLNYWGRRVRYKVYFMEHKDG